MKFLAILPLLFSLSFALVDINKADIKTLKTLHGIGAKKARSIVEFRNIKCFKTVDSLAKVKGIGLKTIQKNKDNLTASECK